MKKNRTVFRYRGKTVDCYSKDGKHWCAVQGEKDPRGPFKTSGKAVEGAISAVDKQDAVRRQLQKKSISRIMQKAGR